MAGSELKTTISIVDEASKVLDNIAKHAADTASAFDEMIKNVGLLNKEFANTTSAIADTSQTFDKMIQDVGDLIKGFTDASSSISDTAHTLENLSDSAEDASENIEAAAEEIEDLSEKVENACESTEELENKTNDVLKTYHLLPTKCERFENAIKGAFSGARTGIDNISIATQKLGNVIGAPFRKMSQLGQSAFGVLYSIEAALSGIKRSFEMVDQMTLQGARFAQLAQKEGFEGEAVNTRSSEMQAFASKLANEIGVDASSFGAQLMDFANNSAFKSFEEAAQFSTLLNKSFTAAGTGAQEAEGAVRQLLQGLSKGRLQGEDLMSILSAAPSVGGMLEDAYARLYNKSLPEVRGKVRELASQGALTADVIKEAYLGAGDDINKKFDAIPQTFEAAMIRLKNAGMDALQPLMQDLANFVASDEFKSLMDLIKGAFSLAGSIASVVSSVALPVIDGLSGMIGQLTSVGDAVFGAASKRNGNYHPKVPEEQKSYYTMIQKHILKIANEIGVVGDRLLRETMDLVDITRKNALETPQKTFDEIYNERVTDALNNARTRKAEELAMSTVGEDEWNNLGLERQLFLIKDYYDDLEDTGIYSGEQLRDLNDSLEADRIQLEAAIESRDLELKRQEDLRKQIASLEESIRLYGNANFADRRLAEKQNLLRGSTRNLHLAQESINRLNGVEGGDEIGEIAKKELAQVQALEEISRYGKQTAQNTRRVSINRDDILFMRSMTTAEVINRYNNISDSIAINNHYASAPSNAKASGLTSAMLQGAVNALRAG